MHEERTKLLCRMVQESDCRFIVLTQPDEIVMATGFYPLIGLAAAVCFPDREPLMYISENEPLDRCNGILPKRKTACAGDGPFEEWLAAQLAAMLEEGGDGQKTIGITHIPEQPAPVGLIAEGGFLTGRMGKLIEEKTGFFCQDVTAAVRKLMEKKTQQELLCLERVHEVAAVGVDAFYRALREGNTELDVKAAVEQAILLEGKREDIFHSVAWAQIQAGQNTAFSGKYNVSGKNVLQKGDPVLMELAVCVNGFWCDLTRTGVVGEADGQLTEYYEAVKKAQKKAISALRPGMTAGEAYGVAYESLKADGVENWFPHALGHGVGFAYHDKGLALAAGNPKRLEPGMVVTVEPGIYSEAFGGIRIEDNVLITKDGCTVLSGKGKRGLYGTESV